MLSAYAFAKLNLCLDIVGKREDGYHLLRTVMQSVSLCDLVRMELIPQGGIRLECHHPGLCPDEDNTAVRAAKVFFAGHPEIRAGVNIDLTKNIPSQAGMGGGSADAAAVLRLLDLLCQTRHSEEELCAMGLSVGADVPFCVRGGTMLAEGIGERLTPLSDFPAGFFVICKPSLDVSTKEAFSLADRREYRGHSREAVLEKAIQEGDLEGIGRELYNVFQDVLSLREIEDIRAQMLSSGALGACMTGSGSAVFGIFRDRTDADRCRDALRKSYEEVFLCEPRTSGVSVF